VHYIVKCILTTECAKMRLAVGGRHLAGPANEVYAWMEIWNAVLWNSAHT